jgi:hypothetical protein
MGLQASEMAGEAVMGGVSAGGGMEGYYTPTWRAALTALEWQQIGGNAIYPTLDPAADAAINPSYPGTAPWIGGGNLSSMFGGWGGAAWDEASQLLWVFGGGHSGYRGNEGYSIDLDVDDPVWQRRGYPTGSIQLPGSVTAFDANGWDIQGRPFSTQTYELMCVLSNGRVFTGGGGGIWNANGNKGGYEFDPLTDDYDMSKTYVATYGTVYPRSGHAYDPVRDKVWAIGNGRIGNYNLSTLAVTNNYVSYAGGWNPTTLVRYMPEHDMFAFFESGGSIEGSGKSVAVFDPVTPGSAPTPINATTTGKNWGLGGVAYDTLRKRFCWWSGGGTVETLTPPATSPKANAWSYGSLTTSTAVVTPSAASGNGTYGRFWYSEKYDCLFAINTTSERIYALALS